MGRWANNLLGTHDIGDNGVIVGGPVLDASMTPRLSSSCIENSAHKGSPRS